MKYGEGPPDGFTEREWQQALQLQCRPPEELTARQRKLVQRPRLWNGQDPHGNLWSLRQRQEWDAVIYRALHAAPPLPLFELELCAA